MPKDVEFTLSLEGGANPFPITGSRLRNIGQILMVEIRKQFLEVAKETAQEFEMYYRAKQGQGDTDKRDGSLVSQILAAITTLVQYERNGLIPDLVLNVLDLNKAYGATQRVSNQGRSYNLFDLLENQGSGRVGGSRLWGFLSLDHALGLAELVIKQYQLSPEHAAGFKSYVRTNMSGRHGQGIMVKLDEPVFFAYPKFGHAIDHGVKFHPGFSAWNTVKGARYRTSEKIQIAMHQAIRNASNRMSRGDFTRSPMQ